MPFVWIDVEFLKFYGPIILLILYCAVTAYLGIRSTKNSMFYGVIPYMIVVGLVSPFFYPVFALAIGIEKAGDKISPGREKSEKYQDELISGIFTFLGMITVGLVLMMFEFEGIEANKKQIAKDTEFKRLQAECVCKK